jgi:ceramide glucosyltransferase
VLSVPAMIFAWAFGLLAVVGIAYTLFGAIVVARFAGRPAVFGPAEPVSLLKPLHGAEPRLAENLSTFLDQDWQAPIQMVAGVQRGDDPARDIIAGLVRPEIDLRLDATPHGGNAKVANLINMAPAARHDLIVLSDSDMAAPRDYLSQLAGALGQPGVGAATCVYRGRGDAGPWSALAAAGISYHFLPQLLIGLALGLARPGMGSTIALRRSTLESVGGFAPFADSLADDYELCEAVRGLGLRVAVPPLLLVHGCTERSLGEIWRHERRWAATILRINPGGQIGTIVTYPVPMALLALPFSPYTGLVLLIAAVGARWWLKGRVDRLAGADSAPGWLLPLRDILSFLVFLSAFFARSVDWRGRRLTMGSKGRIAV